MNTLQSLSVEVRYRIGTTDADVCGRTGHHLMNNAESYVDERNAFRALTGGRALAGWDNTQTHIQLPGFDCIAASRDVIDGFIE
jgi:hypothetical protein